MAPEDADLDGRDSTTRTRTGTRQQPASILRRGAIAGSAIGLAGMLALAFWLQRDPMPAPEITFQTIGHGPIELSSLRGRPVLVTFWATTCPACIREMPHLFELYLEQQARGLEIIGVAMPYDPPNLVARMAREREIPYPVAIDVLAEATRAFGNVTMTPTSFLIAPDGRVVQRSVGALDMDSTRRKIAAMLNS